MIIDLSAKYAQPMLKQLLELFVEKQISPMILKDNREDYNRLKAIMTERGMHAEEFDGCMRWIFEVTQFNSKLGDELRRKAMNSW